jgi:hypothetical protein
MARSVRSHEMHITLGECDGTEREIICNAYYFGWLWWHGAWDHTKSILFGGLWWRGAWDHMKCMLLWGTVMARSVRSHEVHVTLGDYGDKEREITWNSYYFVGLWWHGAWDHMKCMLLCGTVMARSVRSHEVHVTLGDCDGTAWDHMKCMLLWGTVMARSLRSHEVHVILGDCDGTEREITWNAYYFGGLWWHGAWDHLKCILLWGTVMPRSVTLCSMTDINIIKISHSWIWIFYL